MAALVLRLCFGWRDDLEDLDSSAAEEQNLFVANDNDESFLNGLNELVEGCKQAAKEGDKFGTRAEKVDRTRKPFFLSLTSYCDLT